MSASDARRLARDVVSRVRERSGYAHEVLDSALRRASLPGDEVSFATRLAYGAIQTQGTLDEALDVHLGKKHLESRVRDALRVATYEILFLRTPSRAAVHQGVELVRELRPQAAGLANAVLRRVADQAASFPWGDPATDVAALARLHGHPRWLVDMWIDELGRDATEHLLEADNEPAPLYVAENPFAGTFVEARAALRSDGATPESCPVPGCLKVGDPSAAVRGTALERGLVLAADAAAQFVAQIVRARPGDRVLEIGAGRGTKTILIQGAAVRAGGPARITAVDLHEFKARLLEERLRRFEVPGVDVLTGDAADLASVQGIPAAGEVDTAIIDAPCTGLGTLRRHPEKRWRVGPQDIAVLARLGGILLREAARLVRPGGFVVYSTCTVADRENADVIREFLASPQGRAFRIDSLADEVPEEWRRFVTAEGFFRSLSASGGPDGHFAARLVRG